MLVRAARTRPPAEQVVIVDVDERSLAAIGQWPWRRDVIARLIGGLRDRGASAIALDIVFGESERHDTGAASTDPVLADAIRQGRVVLGYAMTFDPDSPAAKPCVQHPLGLLIIGSGGEPADDDPLFAPRARSALPILSQAAETSGFLNAAPDADGLLRRAPMVMEFGGRIYPRSASPPSSRLTACAIPRFGSST
jgi:adenylate cyclase